MSDWRSGSVRTVERRRGWGAEAGADMGFSLELGRCRLIPDALIRGHGSAVYGGETMMTGG